MKTKKTTEQDFLSCSQEKQSSIELDTTIPANDTPEKISELKEEYKEETVKKERKPRTTKPKNIVEPEKKPDEDFLRSVSGVGSMLMAMVVDRLPKPEPLKDTEKIQINLVFDRLILKYSSYLGKFQEESAFLLVVAMVVMPRINLLGKKEKESKEETGVK